MVDLRMKLFVLAGVATIFSGMAYGQATCTQATANAVFVRSESNDDQVADTTITCTVPTGNAPVQAGQTISLTVYLSPSVNITSANIGTSSSPKYEAVAGYNASSTSFGGTPVFGSVSGNSVTFSGITLPGITVGGTQTLTITNIKIQASSVATGTGVPTGISETIFVSGTGVTPNAITTGSAVAYVTSGLSVTAKSTTTIATNTLCSAVTAAAANYTVAFTEGFPYAFKSQGGSGNSTLGSWYTNHTETGYYVTNNTATSGTRVQLAFANVPTNVTVYVPITLTGTNGGTMVLTASATGALSPVAASTASGAPTAVGAAAVTLTSGSGTAVYEDTQYSNSPSTFPVSVYLVSKAGAVAAPTTPITTTVSFAPIGASTNVPNFISGASTATVTGSTYTACTTTLLFPFVTNVSGFESGLAISNTGADLLGGTTSSVTGQSGTCLLTFFGSPSGTANTAPYTTTTSVAPGTTWTGTLTSVTGNTPGNAFPGAASGSGYMIAQCNFLFAHGFTYITYNLGQSSAVAMGYLALEVNTTRTATPSAPEQLGN